MKAFALFFAGFSFLINIQLRAQSINFDYNYQLYNQLESKLPSSFHTSIKPYQLGDIKSVELDSVFRQASFFKSFERNDSSNTRLELSPVFDITNFVNANTGKSFSKLAYGINSSLIVGESFGINFRYSRHVTDPVSYEKAFAAKTRTIAGTSRFHARNNLLFSNNFQGGIHYKANRHFTFSGGFDKHFIGEGYRSLLLSDFAPSSPYIRVMAEAGRFRYMVLYNAYADYFVDSSPARFGNKFGSLHYLSWNVSKWLNLGFFETIIMKKRAGNGLGIDVNYLNPVIFFRPVEYSVGSNDNALLGGAIKLTPFRKHHIYFQLLLDEFLLKEVRAENGWWANKQAFQLGYKTFDLFGVNHLNLTLEYNYVRPFTYSHAKVSQNYGHYNQTLAHPLGANFKEMLAIINYQIGQVGVELKLINAVTVKDSILNEGRDIFRSYTSRTRDYGYYTAKSNTLRLPFVDLRVHYMPSIRGRMQVFAGYLMRKQSSYLEKGSASYLYFGLQTAFGNSYRDY